MSLCPIYEEDVIGSEYCGVPNSEKNPAPSKHNFELFSQKPWYERWLLRTTALFAGNQKELKELCENADVVYRTPFEYWVLEITKDVTSWIRIATHFIIGYLLYAGVRTGLISEYTFAAWCFCGLKFEVDWKGLYKTLLSRAKK